ncbi:hypothetical protein GCM10017600_59460 [Streptosporangium carneum]|uniref:Acetyl xylan esterase domain-containing protein n=1 Tax=Streptosporangium carneum TaxID=47481 RepID=A0A9W6MFR3_9ACTN|nr:hypothetical protein GCM10017600_59460 [Streptosporangium carneum]
MLDPGGHYYRRVFTDAVRAVGVARGHPAVDPGRVAVHGMSQDVRRIRWLREHWS